MRDQRELADEVASKIVEAMSMKELELAVYESLVEFYEDCDEEVLIDAAESVGININEVAAGS